MSTTQSQFDITKQLIETPTSTLGLNSTQKAILVTLSSYLGTENNGVRQCWPSQKTLSDLTGYARPTVSTALKAISDKGFLTAEQRFNSSKIYTWNGIQTASNEQSDDSEARSESSVALQLTENEQFHQFRNAQNDVQAHMNSPF
ncbi:TPA: helix-turn-helix domain-containing protein [Photobacterium damselae]